MSLELSIENSLSENNREVLCVNARDAVEAAAVDRLIQLFNQTFGDFNTRLVRGDDEPVYLPADSQCRFHQVIFAHGFFSSALHEIAHWCIAGEARRTQVDYGYWYCPDGRDAQQQRVFEQVEVKPQAIEWALSVACGRLFGVSSDNLKGVEPDRQKFANEVKHQLQAYFSIGFPPRAQRFIDACCLTFESPPVTLSRCLSASKDLI